MAEDKFNRIPPPPPGFELIPPSNNQGDIPPPPPGFELLSEGTNQFGHPSDTQYMGDSPVPMGSGTPEPAGLPQPAAEMYEGVNPEDQQSIYEAYTKHPLSDMTTGKLVYRGVEVPEPVGGFLKRLGPNIAGTAYNIGRNIAQTGTAVRDVLTGREDAKAFDEAIPEYDPRSLGGGSFEKFLVEMGEIGGGAVGGYKLAQKGIEKIAPQIPNVVKTLGAFAGGEAGMATTVDQDVDTLITGENAMWQLVGGLGKDSEDNYSEDLLRKRMDILIDSAMVTPVGAAALKGAAGIGKFLGNVVLKPVFRLGNPEAREVEVTRNILDQLIDIGPNDTPEMIAQKQEQIIKTIEENKDVLFKFDDMSQEDIQFMRDTMSALEKGEVIPEMMARAKGVRSKMEGRAGSKLEAQMAEPALQTERRFTETEQALGGEPARTQARESIQESTYQQIDNYKDEALRARQRLVESDEGINSLLKEDPTFGSLLEDLGTATNIDLTGPVNRQADEILSKVNKASTDMTKIKNDMFEAIPEGLPPNNELLTQQFDENVVPHIEGTDLMAKLGEAATDFKKLYKFANVDLEQHIKKLVGEGKFEAVADLRNFKHHVQQDQLQHVIDTTGNSQAREAMDYYKEYAKFWRDGRLSVLQDQQRNLKLRPDDKSVAQRKTLTQTLKDPEAPEYTERIIELLERPEAGENAESVLDFAIGNIAKDLKPHINTKGAVDPKVIADYTNKLDSLLPVFRKFGQEQRLNQFMEKLRDKSISRDELAAEADRLVKLADTAEKEIMSGPLGKFFDQGGARTNTSAVFQDVFSSDEAIRDLPDLVKNARATGGEEAVDGLRSAYIEFLSERVFREGQGKAGERLVDALTDKQLDDILAKGDSLFEGEKKQVYDALKFLTKEAFDMQRRRGPGQSPIMDITEITKASKRGLDFMVTMVFGVLNRTGARIRQALGRSVDRLDPKESIRRTMDIVLSNPDEFIRLGKMVSEAQRKGMSPEARNRLFSVLVKSGIYHEEDKELFEQGLTEASQSNLDKQTQENFQ